MAMDVECGGEGLRYAALQRTGADSQSFSSQYPFSPSPSPCLCICLCLSLASGRSGSRVAGVESQSGSPQSSSLGISLSVTSLSSLPSSLSYLNTINPPPPLFPLPSRSSASLSLELGPTGVQGCDGMDSLLVQG